MSEYKKLPLCERFCKSIGNLLLGRDNLELDRFILNLFSLVIPLNVIMLAPAKRFVIFGKNYYALVIVVNDHCTEGKTCVLGQD